MRPPAYRALLFTSADVDLVTQAQRFRKKVFVDLCGWNLSLSGDREVDQFDAPGASHCLLLENGEIRGCFRATRTDRPYLAAEVFPQLAIVSPYPRRPDVWEISRFGVCGAGARDLGRVNYALMFWFARQVRASSLVAIADLAYERFLRGIGIRTRRFGPPSVIGLDRHGRDLRVVAGEIPLALQDPAAVAALLRHLEDVEITDVAQVLGPARVSA